MRLALTTLAVLLLSAAPAAASSGSLAISHSGSGGQIGQYQTVTATMTNSGSDAFRPRICIGQYSPFLTFKPGVDGGLRYACTYWNETLAAGASKTVKWTFAGASYKSLQSAGYQVTFFNKTTNQKLASQTGNYTVSANQPLWQITELASPLDRLWQIGDRRTISLQIENNSDSRTSLLCMQANASFRIENRNVNNNCLTLNYPLRGSGTTDIELTALRPSRGNLLFTLQNETAIFDNFTVAYEIEAARATISLSKVRRQGGEFSRWITVYNNSGRAFDFDLCLRLRKGRLISFDNQSSRCIATDELYPGKSVSVLLTVSSRKAQGQLQLTAPGVSGVIATRKVSFR